MEVKARWVQPGVAGLHGQAALSALEGQHRNPGAGLCLSFPGHNSLFSWGCASSQFSVLGCFVVMLSLYGWSSWGPTHARVQAGIWLKGLFSLLCP